VFERCGQNSAGVLTISPPSPKIQILSSVRLSSDHETAPIVQTAVIIYITIGLSHRGSMPPQKNNPRWRW